MAYPRCPRCLERGPTGLCDAHIRAYSDCCCIDCGNQLTEETYAEYLVSLGPPTDREIEPGEALADPMSFATVARTADVVEIVCITCKQRRLNATNE
jgi:hypothetical protein